MATVLVVDDEPDIRYVTQLNLELDGHRVRTAADGVEALAAIEVEVPDLLLLDVMMPEVDGWAVLEQLKSHFDAAIANVRVIMLTALGGSEDRLRGGIEGAIHYLVKPVDPDDLRAAVTAALAGDEPTRRREVQADALQTLARVERGADPDEPMKPGPRLTRLERPPVRAVAERARDVTDQLTDAQRAVVAAIAETGSVRTAAAALETSRSNMYASLRRIARNLDVASVPDLITAIGDGRILVTR